MFPAHVSLATGERFDPVLALIGMDRIWVYNSDSHGGTLVAEFGLDDLRGTAQHGYTAETDAGTVRVVRSRGCGCGSKLGSWNPFPIRQIHVALSR